MWARHFEFVLALWLAISWLIFGYTGDQLFLGVNDGICFILITLFSLLSYYHALRKLHLMNLAVSAWLIGLAYTSASSIHEGPYQNYMVVGFLLLMFAIIPVYSNDPPEAWQNYLKKRR
jgi:hypothetical protein